MKKLFKIIGIILGVLCLLLLAVFVNHKIQLHREAALFKPLGTLVEVDGHNMSVYIEGSGDKTLVFLSGGGTCSPILDFKSLYSRLSADYKIAVVEKFGYGFSDEVNSPRDIRTMLNQTRTALQKAGCEGPYVLCPHSLSGLEAIYWAQQFPEEVEAIVGLDMAVPQYYDEMKISIPVMRIGQLAASFGFTRLIPDIWKGAAVTNGTLTPEETDIYKAVFFRRTATSTMIKEAEMIYKNADIVKLGGVPEVPMLLFISNGSGGTGFSEETWRQIPIDFLSQSQNGKYIELDCPHYVHDYEYERISSEIMSFIG